MAIYIITGHPGSGKTLYLAKKAMWILSTGRHIYSNFILNVEKKYKKQVSYWSHLHELEKMEKGVILMDEAQRYFNPRRWSMLSEEIEMKLQQHRKDGLDIYGTTQHYTRIDVTLRILVESFYKCKKLISSKEHAKHPWGVVRVTEHFLEDMEKDEEEAPPVATSWMLIRKKYTDFYDTTQIIKISKTMPLVHRERICPVCKEKKIIHY